MKIFQWLVLAGLGAFLTMSMAQDPAPTSVNGLLTATGAYEKSEQDLQEAYSKLMVALKPVGKERLEKAQVAWAQYREAQATFNCYHVAGGPFEKMEYYAQLRKETDKRTKDLQQTYEWVRKLAMTEQ